MSVSFHLIDLVFVQQCYENNQPIRENLQISDFGMSRNLMDESYYISHGGKIPVKWTAPEVGSNLKLYNSQGSRL